VVSAAHSQISQVPTDAHEALREEDAPEDRPRKKTSDHIEAAYVAMFRFLVPKLGAAFVVILGGTIAGGMGGTLFSREDPRIDKMEDQVRVLNAQAEAKTQDLSSRIEDGREDLDDLEEELMLQRRALVRLSRNGISEQRFVIDSLAILMEAQGVPDKKRPKVPRVVQDAQEKIELQNHDEWLFGDSQ